MWSKSEKVIASKTLEAALERELQGVIQEAKRMASRVWRGHYLVSLFPLDVSPVRRNFTIQLALSQPTLGNEVDSSELIRACVSGGLMLRPKKSNVCTVCERGRASFAGTEANTLRCMSRGLVEY